MTHNIILQQELEEAAYKCRKALQQANDALKELLKLDDYPTPTTLKEVTLSHLISLNGHRVDAVMASPIYTQEQKNKAINEWTQWRIKAMPHVAAVENFVTDWKDVSPVLDTADMTICTTDLTEALTPRFTVEVPLQAHTHIALIHKVREAYNELRAWEAEQDIKKVELKKLLSIAENDLFQSWAAGNIKVDHTHDTPSLIAWRKANNEAII